MLREIFTFLGFQFDESGFKRAKAGSDELKKGAVETASSFNGLSKGIQGALALLSTGAVVAFANSIADQAFEVGKLSEQLGISTHDLQAWEFGAKGVGLSAGDLSTAFRRLATDIAGGSGGTGTKTGNAVLARLGVDAHDSAGKARELGAVLPDIADKISKMTNATEKVAIAQQIFGRSGARLLPILNKGREGVAQLTAEFDRLGGGFSPEAIKRAQEYEREIAKLKVTFDSLKSLLAVSVLPFLTKTVDKLIEGSIAFKKFSEQTTFASNGVKILAGVLAGQLALALAPYLGTGLKFAAIYLAVDDLLAFLDGKDTVIGDLLNRAFGQGTATAVRQWCNDARDNFAGWLEGFKVVVPDIFNAFALTFAKTKQSWDEMILGFEQGWNDLVKNLHLPDALKFDHTLERRGAIDQDKAGVAQAQAKKDATGQAVANFNQANTALSNPTDGGHSGVGPLRAPVITQNFVELKPNISIQVPVGTSQAHAERLVREAAAGISQTERRAAGQALTQKGG